MKNHKKSTWPAGCTQIFLPCQVKKALHRMNMWMTIINLQKLEIYCVSQSRFFLPECIAGVGVSSHDLSYQHRVVPGQWTSGNMFMGHKPKHKLLVWQSRVTPSSSLPSRLPGLSLAWCSFPLFIGRSYLPRMTCHVRGAPCTYAPLRSCCENVQTLMSNALSQHNKA